MKVEKSENAKSAMQLEKSPKRMVKHKTLKFSKEYGDLSGLKQSIKN